MSTTEREAQTCGRRMTELGPWPHEENLDHWRRDRWKMTKEEADREVAAFMERNPGGSMGDPQWHGPPAEQPRTCSFCGGVHPDDALALIRAGWEVEGTDKSYKRYLNPPGSHMRHRLMMQRLREQPGTNPFEALPSVWSPLPPVKVYVQHFSQEQVDQWNAAARSMSTGGGDAK